MKAAYKPLWVLLLVCAGVGAVVVYARLPKSEERIPWRTDFAAARVEAAQTGKPVFAYFTASWCGPCQSLKSTTWANKDVDAALQNYIPVKIDIDEHASLARRYVPTPSNPDGAIPAFRVLDDSGEIRKEMAGALPPRDFLAWLGSK